MGEHRRRPATEERAAGLLSPAGRDEGAGSEERRGRGLPRPVSDRRITVTAPQSCAQAPPLLYRCQHADGSPVPWCTPGVPWVSLWDTQGTPVVHQGTGLPGSMLTAVQERRRLGSGLLVRADWETDGQPALPAGRLAAAAAGRPARPASRPSRGDRIEPGYPGPASWLAGRLASQLAG